jgi:alkanesulfonate monooxygenase SsuD/methylene tetrahydromethanopterin reductase-like flavin-dependent oxidoreductase (luciferase family)
MAWQLFPYSIEIGAAIVLFVVLIWAGHERASVHRRWRNLRREAGERDPRLTQWCVAVGTVAGCA